MIGGAISVSMVSSKKMGACQYEGLHAKQQKVSCVCHTADTYGYSINNDGADTLDQRARENEGVCQKG